MAKIAALLSAVGAASSATSHFRLFRSKLLVSNKLLPLDAYKNGIFIALPSWKLS